MMTPDDIDVWVGLDVGKSAHHAHALDHDGNTLYDKPLKQDEKAIRTMLGKLSKHGRVLLVVDQPNTIGSLPLTVARNMGIAIPASCSADVPRQVRQCFSAVWADGFPRCRHRFPVM